MAALLPRLFSDMTDWFDLDPRGSLIRVEDVHADGEYRIRAELPGVDPEKDIQVTVSDGVLEIRAERREEEYAKHHSEFRYGMLHRAVRLPAGAVESDIKAKYDRGVLTITVPIKEPKPTGRTIPIET